MITDSRITQSLIEQYEHPRAKAQIGNTLILEDSIGAGSFVIRGGASNGQAFAPGGCVSASLSFSILNFDGTYNSLNLATDTEVIASIGYGDDTFFSTYQQVGVFYISDIKRTKNVINVVCYDKLHKGDKVQFTPTATTMTAAEIITAAASQAGIPIGRMPASGGSVSVEIPADLNITCRQALMYALEISGNYGFMDYQGRLKCGWYDFSSSGTTKSISDYFQADFDEITQYTGVQVEGYDVSGTSQYVFVLSGNPFVTDANAQAITQRLYSCLVGKTFDAGTVGILADPRIEPGDYVEILYMDNTGAVVSKLVPVTSYTLKGSLIETISCEALTADAITDMRANEDPDAIISEARSMDSAVLQAAKDYTDSHSSECLVFAAGTTAVGGNWTSKTRQPSGDTYYYCKCTPYIHVGSSDDISVDDIITLTPILDDTKWESSNYYDYLPLGWYITGHLTESNGQIYLQILMSCIHPGQDLYDASWSMKVNWSIIKKNTA